jgi:hypothetical protein
MVGADAWLAVLQKFSMYVTLNLMLEQANNVIWSVGAIHFVFRPYDAPSELGKLVNYEIPGPDEEEASEETISNFRDFIRENAWQELEHTLALTGDSTGYEITKIDIVTMTNTGTPVEV